MKKYTLLGVLSIALILLNGCASNSSYYKAQVRNDLVKEDWMRQVNTDTTQWTAHADDWYFSNEPSKFEDYASKAPISKAVTAMMVRVPNFTDLKISGPYRVQIAGDQDQNTLFVLGTNDAARQTKVDIRGDMLYIHPATDCKSCAPIKDVIIRVGIHELHQLIVNDSATVEGKHIVSRGLTIQSSGRSNILLAGSMNITSIMQQSGGTLSVLGANTPSLKIKIPSDGNVNLSGHVGVCRIHKRGKGTLNIIGADTDSLKINSAGSGTISIVGFVNLKNVNVQDTSQVYVYWINSDGIYGTVHGRARLGLAGVAKNLDIEVDGASRFYGKFLRTDNIYIRTRQAAHANVDPAQKLFATALNNSSIYFFSSPNVVSRYNMDNGVILPVWCETCGVPMTTPKPVAPPAFIPRPSYKGEMSYKDEMPRKHVRHQVKGQW